MQKKLHNPKSHSPAVYIPCWLSQVPVKKISNNSKIVYGRLAQWSTETGKVYRSAPQLAEETGMHVRVIERALKELRDVDLIGTYQPIAGGSNNFEFYDHPWMHEPINSNLTYKYHPPTETSVPPDKFVGTPPTETSVSNIKEIKTNKNNINKNTREKEISSQELISQKISRTTFSEMLQLPPPEINEDEKMNPRFENGYHVGPFDAHRQEQERQQIQAIVKDATIAEQTSPNQLALRQQYGLTEVHEAEFDIFWEIYPSKKNKERIRTLWYAQGCHLMTATIITKLMQQIKEDCCFLDGYHPSAYNYLKDRRWEDEIEVRKKKGTFDHTDGSWANSDRKSIFE